jgi:transcriptional regulator with XRE-family HTH domain
MRAIQRFGRQLQRLRAHRGLTQEQLAVRAGLARLNVTKLEQGEHDPMLSTLVRLAKTLRVPVTELLGERERKPVVVGGGGSLPDATGSRGSARTLSEMFIARYQNKPGGPVRRLLPVRETK